MNSQPTPQPAPPPAIPPVPEGVARPFWSVMIPTYNAGEFLEIALKSVLAQDPGPDRMQIAVVDDHSPGAEQARTIVNRLAPQRVAFHVGNENLGLAGNWNRCIGLARGRWIHLLHQDDMVLPGFYERLTRADAEAPEAGAAFCQNAVIDDDGCWRAISSLERSSPGLLEDWLPRLADTQRIQCPSIVIPRRVYELVGGFRPELVYAVDWEMWVRIAARSPFWYEPTVLACYREHRTNETSRIRALDRDFEDVRNAIAIVKTYLPNSLQAQAGAGLLKWVRGRALTQAANHLRAGNLSEGMARFRHACLREPGLRFSRVGRSYYKWYFKLQAKRLLQRLFRPEHKDSQTSLDPVLHGEKST